jgi:serine acetyltransferase
MMASPELPVSKRPDTAATVIEHKRIGVGSIVGVGAVVVEAVPEGAVVGVAARAIRSAG